MGRRRKYQNQQERLEAKRARARASYHKRKEEETPTDKEFKRLLHLNPDLFPTKAKLTNEQKQFIHSLITQPLTTPTIKRKTRHNESIAKQQLGIATS